MSLRCLVFILMWCPAALRAQSAAESCSAPQTDGGFLVPEQETYLHGSSLAYACNDGWKPAVEGWWATSLCLNGSWSHTPRCIDESSCLPPDIPNAKYTESSEGWYQEGWVLRIKCDEGYQHKTWEATVTCKNGAWSSLHVCERSGNACMVPPKIPHAVIILQKYQEIFAADSEVQFECEEGYSVQPADTKKSIFCLAGGWSEAPNCTKSQVPDVGHDGDTLDKVTKPVDANRGRGRGTHTGGSTVAETGSATTSDRTDSTSTPLVVQVTNCGAYPHISNGDVVRKSAMFIKYACNAFYKRVGPDTVVCYNDGTWSEVPTCKEAFCEVDLDEYANYHIKESGTIILKERETRDVPCKWQNWISRIRCTKGKISVSRCCHYLDYYSRLCN
ncbi:complement factor H-like [Dunckerocampus dactyliophorus]|uniref:complement factor H-like n=1 Tax=Dunckerocampus dactyliophorus TaxID=161453 RepID=UPI002406632D|nr:complement factor H-like [Dunckerocampus dactyliophorus]